MSAELGPRRRGFSGLVIVVRAGLLLMGLVLALLSPALKELLPTFVALVAIAAAASIPLQSELARRMQPVVEAVAAAVVIAVAAPQEEVFLPYLIAPALAGGLTGGLVTAVTAVGMAAAVLFVRGFTLSSDTVGYLSSTTPWVIISLATGLLAAWVKRILDAQTQPTDPSYEAAYRLLSQLRAVSRQLSGGLDAISIAQSLLESLSSRSPHDVGAVYARAQSGQFVPLALSGADQVDWDHVVNDAAGRDRDGPAVVRGSTRFDGSPGAFLLLPLQVGARSTGLVALEAAGFSEEDVESAAATVQDAALRLETALLFGDVRSIATAEERRRLAREIHDGIAQELASLGYAVDDLTARARRESGRDLEEPLRELRREVTRIISELRLSIFDLRSEVHADIGLGSALSDYVRSVGRGSPLTVHLVLDEAPARLRVETETELLRVAQEAITNARRHAGAHNLWVTCRVDPPRALIRVEDDGGGMKGRRNDSFGMDIMRERANRLGAVLSIRERAEGGTSVEVAVGNGWPVDGHDRGGRPF